MEIINFAPKNVSPCLDCYRADEDKDVCSAICKRRDAYIKNQPYELIPCPDEDELLLQVDKRKSNLCTECGVRKPVPGFGLCKQCIDSEVVPKPIAKNDLPLCSKCGKRKAKEGSNFCGWCGAAEKRVKANREKQETLTEQIKQILEVHAEGPVITSKEVDSQKEITCTVYFTNYQLLYEKIRAIAEESFLPVYHVVITLLSEAIAKREK